MDIVILAIARFRSDKKEAISKNFVNLAQCLADDGHKVITISPTGFITDHRVEQHTFRNESRYDSLFEGVINLFRTCNTVEKLLSATPEAKVSLHIATPVELFMAFIFLKSRYRRQTSLSIWQSYLTYDEFMQNRRFLLTNWPRYLHLMLLNSFISAPLYKLFLRYFKQVIVHSDYQRKQLVPKSAIPVYFVQNGVYSGQFDPPVIEKSGQQISLLYIGHAKPSKGVDALIELASVLKQRGKLNFTLTLCFSGFGDENTIKKLVEKYELTAHTRYKDNIDVAVEMAGADLLVLPLRTCVGTSLTPNLIIEAMSCGLPIAIPEFEQLSGVVQFGSNAVKIDLNDLDKSAATLENHFNLQQSDHLSNNQIKQFKQSLTLEKFASGYSQKLGLR